MIRQYKQEKDRLPDCNLPSVEAVPGFEHGDTGLADHCLTAWLHPYWEERAGTKSHPSLFVGWVKGLEPSTPGTTIRCSNQLSYTHQI